MGFLMFVFLWLLVGALTFLVALWLMRHEQDVPYKAFFGITLAGMLAPFILIFVVIGEKIGEDFRNPFYKENKNDD